MVLALLPLEAVAKADLKNLIKKIEWSDEETFNALVVIAKGSKIIQHHTITREKNQQSFKRSSHARIGSISKQITAVIILRLVASGKLNLEAPVGDYLPDDTDEATRDLLKEVTLHHLLSHSSGIDGSKQQIAESGVVFSYANWSYKLLGKIAEKASGKSFQDLSQALFQEAAMKTAYISSEMPMELARQHNPLLIAGYRRQKDGSFVNANPDLEIEAAAVGGVIASAQDLINWNQRLHKGRLLPAKLYKKLTAAHSKTLALPYGATGYGYGTYISLVNKDVEYAHHGLVHGFRSLILYYPRQDLTFVLFINSDELDREGAGIGVLQKLLLSIRGYVSAS